MKLRKHFFGLSNRISPEDEEMIESAAMNDGSGNVPIEYADMELMMEWGISYDEFYNTPAVVLDRYREYLRAKGNGLKRKQKLEENLAKLKK